MPAQVTTQAPPSHVRTSPKQDLQLYINKLKYDLQGHAQNHVWNTFNGIFDPLCAECIYWAAKVVQHPDIWQGQYCQAQRANLRNVPMEVINAAIAKIAISDPIEAFKPLPFTSQEYLQVVNA